MNIRGTLRGLPVVVVAAAPLVLLYGCLPEPNNTYKTENRLVFPVVASGPSTIDGRATDAAWANGFRFVMEDGGSFPAATLRGVADASFLYVHAEVEDDGFEATDVLVIGLNPTNTSGGYHRIHLFPCKLTGSCPENTPNLGTSVDYFTGTFGGSAYAWSAGSAAAAGIEAKSATTSAPKKWQVEVKIPRGAPFNFTTTNFFGYFVDVARTSPSTGVDGEAVQYTWPPDQFIGAMSENDILAQLETGTLAPAAWGNATLASGFGNGVSIDGSGIQTNHPSDPSAIRLSGSNVFYAKPFNNQSTGGTLVAARNVRATFHIADFGLPGPTVFALVPGAANPTGPSNIPPAASATLATGGWTLNSAEVTKYTARPNQCIRVTLTADPGTVFVNSTAMRNMHFTSASSPFREQATVTTKGVEPSQGRMVGYTLREVFVNFDPRLTWTTEIGGATRLAEGVYRTETSPDGAHALRIQVEPLRVRIPDTRVRLLPGTGGTERPAVRIDVKGEELLTLIASGTIEVDGQEVTAGGVLFPDRSKDRQPMRVGALLGSFDEFKESSFVVGMSATIKVPRGAQALHLKLEDEPQRYEKHRGEGYDIQVVSTPIESWMASNNPEILRAVKGNDVFVTPGANLPTWMLRGSRDTGRVIRIGGKTFRVHSPAGSFGYILRHIR